MTISLMVPQRIVGLISFLAILAADDRVGLAMVISDMPPAVMLVNTKPLPTQSTSEPQPRGIINYVDIDAFTSCC